MRVLVAVLLVLVAACATPASAKRGSRGVHLVAVATCTQMLCPNGSCCNACTFGGWFDEKRGLRAVAAPGARALPTCEVDGCGRCDFSLDAEGTAHPDEGTLVVTAWRRR